MQRELRVKLLNDLAERVVDHERRIEVLNLRDAAVRAEDSFSPGRPMRNFRGLTVLPEIEGTCELEGWVQDEGLANQVGLTLPAWCYFTHAGDHLFASDASGEGKPHVFGDH